jgi:hypothetical protein
VDGLTSREIPGIAQPPFNPDPGAPMSDSTTLLPDGRRPGGAFRAWLVPVILGGGALALALVTRYVWIESTEIGLTCSALPPPWWCEFRYQVIMVHQHDGWGLAALATGILALLTRWYPLALLSLMVGVIGLVLYNTGLAAVGLLAGLFPLIRR